jgi:transposase-like protein
VLERALAAEMTGHLGHETHDPAVRGSGSSRNCITPKTALTDVGAVDLAVPRNRTGLLANHRGAVMGGREAAAKRGRRGEPADV